MGAVPSDSPKKKAAQSVRLSMFIATIAGTFRAAGISEAGPSPESYSRSVASDQDNHRSCSKSVCRKCAKTKRYLVNHSEEFLTTMTVLCDRLVTFVDTSYPLHVFSHFLIQSDPQSPPSASLFQLPTLPNSSSLVL